MSKLLIGDGLHEHSLVPLKVGLNIAKALGFKVNIIHADKLADFETLDTVFAHLNLEIHQDYVNNIVKANEKALKEQIKKIDMEVDELDFISRAGTPVDVIIDEVETHRDDYELVVIGHEQEKKLSHLILGSTAEGITNRSPKSVLIAKSLSAYKPKKIAVAYDFSYHCDSALDWAKKLSLAYGAEVHLLNIIPCYYEGYHTAHTIHESFNEAIEGMIEESSKKITERLNKIATELAQEFKIIPHSILDREGSISQKIVDFSDKNDIDIIVMGSHKKGQLKEMLLGSVCNKVVRKSNVSVLISK